MRNIHTLPECITWLTHSENNRIQMDINANISLFETIPTDVACAFNAAFTANQRPDLTTSTNTHNPTRDHVTVQHSLRASEQRDSLLRFLDEREDYLRMLSRELLNPDFSATPSLVRSIPSALHRTAASLSTTRG